MDLLSPTSSLVEFEQKHVVPRVGRTAIIGSKIYREKEDRRKRYADCVGIDMLDGEGVDVARDLENSIPFDWIFAFDHIECMSVLEHSRRPWLLAANIERMLRPGGTLFVSVPFVWRVHAYPSDYWRMTPAALPELFPEIEWQERALCSFKIESSEKLKAVKVNQVPYLPRCETAGFGVRK